MQFNVAHTKFLFTTVTPYGPPHKEAIARRVNYTLAQAGVNTNFFSSHTCRSYASSNAINMGVDLDTILKLGCWSRQSTFRKFYSRVRIHGQKIIELLKPLWTVLTIRVCNGIYDIAINIHYPKYFQSAFQFQISLTNTPPGMQVNRNHELKE